MEKARPSSRCASRRRCRRSVGGLAAPLARPPRHSSPRIELERKRALSKTGGRLPTMSANGTKRTCPVLDHRRATIARRVLDLTQNFYSLSDLSFPCGRPCQSATGLNGEKTTPKSRADGLVLSTRISVRQGHEDRRYLRNRVDRIQGRREAETERSRCTCCCAEHGRQHHHWRWAKGSHGRRAGGGRPRQFAFI